MLAGVSQVLQSEQDLSTKRNAFQMLCNHAQHLAVNYLLSQARRRCCALLFPVHACSKAPAAGAACNMLWGALNMHIHRQCQTDASTRARALPILPSPRSHSRTRTLQPRVPLKYIVICCTQQHSYLHSMLPYYIIVC